MRKKTDVKARPLTLATETLRQLSSRDLRHVAGGGSTTCQANSKYCPASGGCDTTGNPQ